MYESRGAFNPFEALSNPDHAWEVADRFIYSQEHLSPNAIRSEVSKRSETTSDPMEKERLKRLEHLLLGIRENELADLMFEGHWQELLLKSGKKPEDLTRQQAISMLSDSDFYRTMEEHENAAIEHYREILGKGEKIVCLREKIVISKDKKDLVSYEKKVGRLAYVIRDEDAPDGLDERVKKALETLNKEGIRAEKLSSFEDFLSKAQDYGLSRRQETIDITETDIRVLMLDLQVRQAERLLDPEKREAELTRLDEEFARLINDQPESGKKLELEEMYLIRRLAHNADTGHLMSVRHGTPREDLRQDMGSVDFAITAAGDIFYFQVKTFKQSASHEAKAVQSQSLDRAKRKLPNGTFLTTLDSASIRHCYESSLYQKDSNSFRLANKYDALSPLTDSVEVNKAPKLLKLLGFTSEEFAREEAVMESLLKQREEWMEKRKQEVEERSERAQQQIAEDVRLEQFRRSYTGLTREERKLLYEKDEAERKAKVNSIIEQRDRALKEIHDAHAAWEKAEQEKIRNARAILEEELRLKEAQTAERSAKAAAEIKADQEKFNQKTIPPKEKTINPVIAAAEEREKQLRELNRQKQQKAQAEAQLRREERALKKSTPPPAPETLPTENRPKGRRIVKIIKKPVESNPTEPTEISARETKKTTAGRPKLKIKEIAQQIAELGLPKTRTWPPNKLSGFVNKKILESLGLPAETPQDILESKQKFLRLFAESEKGQPTENNAPNQAFAETFQSPKQLGAPSGEVMAKLKELFEQK